MKMRIGFCKRCNADTKHDVYRDGIIPSEQANLAEWIFFGLTTLGFSEMLSDTYCRC